MSNSVRERGGPGSREWQGWVAAPRLLSRHSWNSCRSESSANGADIDRADLAASRTMIVLPRARRCRRDCRLPLWSVGRRLRHHNYGTKSRRDTCRFFFNVKFFLLGAALMMKFWKNLAGPCGAPTYLPTYL